MAEYKCISCGAVKESEEICNCPDCGYRMFETPYDRKATLISEIERFFKSAEMIVEGRSLAYVEKPAMKQIVNGSRTSSDVRIKMADLFAKLRSLGVCEDDKDDYDSVILPNISHLLQRFLQREIRHFGEDAPCIDGD